MWCFEAKVTMERVGRADDVGTEAQWNYPHKVRRLESDELSISRALIVMWLFISHALLLGWLTELKTLLPRTDGFASPITF